MTTRAVKKLGTIEADKPEVEGDLFAFLEAYLPEAVAPESVCPLHMVSYRHMGYQPRTPDLHIRGRSGAYSGLVIEMKSQRGKGAPVSVLKGRERRTQALGFQQTLEGVRGLAYRLVALMGLPVRGVMTTCRAFEDALDIHESSGRDRKRTPEFESLLEALGNIQEFEWFLGQDMSKEWFFSLPKNYYDSSSHVRKSFYARRKRQRTLYHRRQQFGRYTGRKGR